MSFEKEIYVQNFKVSKRTYILAQNDMAKKSSMLERQDVKRRHIQVLQGFECEGDQDC